jgi:hypothetical protein
VEVHRDVRVVVAVAVVVAVVVLRPGLLLRLPRRVPNKAEVLTQLPSGMSIARRKKQGKQLNVQGMDVLRAVRRITGMVHIITRAPMILHRCMTITISRKVSFE